MPTAAPWFFPSSQDEVDSGAVASAEEIVALQDKIAQLQIQLGEVGMVCFLSAT